MLFLEAWCIMILLSEPSQCMNINVVLILLFMNSMCHSICDVDFVGVS